MYSKACRSGGFCATHCMSCISYAVLQPLDTTVIMGTMVQRWDFPTGQCAMKVIETYALNSHWANSQLKGSQMMCKSYPHWSTGEGNRILFPGHCTPALTQIHKPTLLPSSGTLPCPPKPSPRWHRACGHGTVLHTRKDKDSLLVWPPVGHFHMQFFHIISTPK